MSTPEDWWEAASHNSRPNAPIVRSSEQSPAAPGNRRQSGPSAGQKSSAPEDRLFAALRASPSPTSSTSKVSTSKEPKPALEHRKEVRRHCAGSKRIENETRNEYSLSEGAVFAPYFPATSRLQGHHQSGKQARSNEQNTKTSASSSLPRPSNSSNTTSAVSQSRDLREHRSLANKQETSSQNPLTSSGASYPNPTSATTASPIKRVLPGAQRASTVRRTVLREAVERAIGVNRMATSVSDRETARETVLKWVRSAAAPAPDVFRAVVAGPGVADASLNARSLSFVHWIAVLAGPAALAAACEPPALHRPSLGVRVCMDVLKACGRPVNSAAASTAFEREIRAWELDGGAESGITSTAGAASTGQDATVLLNSALEKYAKVLWVKLAFHDEYPEVEANYSLDRFYRQTNVENTVDRERREVNVKRHAVVISHRMWMQCALLAKGGVVVALALHRAKASNDVVGLAFADASNAYALAEYLRVKLAKSSPPPEYDPIKLEPVREWLARRLKLMQSRSGDSVRYVQRFVEPAVVRTIESPDQGPLRPESRHRREVPCVFSSFEGLHNALAPSFCL